MNVGQVEFSIVADGAESVLSTLQQIQSLANGIDGKKFNIGAKAMRTQAQVARDMSRNTVDAAQLIDRRTRQIAQWGSRMQTLGNGLQRVTSPFMNVFRGFTMGIGYQALGKVMNSVNGAFSRYDTMRTYAKVLNEMGINADKKFRVGIDRARTAVDNLEQSVLGLPTGLDEMVAAMRRYAGSTGEIERATKLAIAANNTYIAGQMEERAKLFTERQLKALAGGAELDTNQWTSLQRNAPLAFRTVANEMKISVNELSESLKKGKIDGQEFLDVFIKVGTEGRIQKAAQKMKMTWSAVSQNITNAFNRMGSNILETIDSVFKETTGRDFLQTVLGVDSKGRAVGGGIKDFIDGVSESIQNFIRTNPDKILNFFNQLRSIDWKGILAGYGDVLRVYGKVAAGFAKVFGGRGFIRAVAIGNVAGKFFTTLGSFARGLAKPIATISLLMGGTKGTGKFASFVKTIAGVSPDMALMAENLGTIRWTKNRLGALYMMQDFSVAMGKLRLVNKALNIGAILAIAGSIKIVASAMKDIQNIDISFPKLTGNLAKMGEAIGAFTLFATGIGAMNFIPKIGTFLQVAKWFGTAELAAISFAIKGMAQAMNELATAEIPSADRITNVIGKLEQIDQAFAGSDPLTSIGKTLDAWSKGAEAGAIIKIVKAFKAIERLGKTRLNEQSVKQAKKNFKIINDFTTEVAGLFEVAEKTVGGETTRFRGKTLDGKGNEVRSYANLKKAVADYAEMVHSLDDAMNGMTTLMTSMKKMNKKYQKMMASNARSLINTKDGTGFSFKAMKENIAALVDGIAGLAEPDEKGSSPLQRFGKVSKQLKDVDVAQVTGVFKDIPKLLTELNQVYSTVSNNPLFRMGVERTPGTLGALGGEIKSSPLYMMENAVGDVFESIGRIQQKIAESGDAAQLKADTAAIKIAIGTIRTIITELQSLSTSGAETSGKISIEGIDTIGTKISTFISKITTALGAMNGVGGVQGLALNAGALYAAVSGIKKAINSLSTMNFDQIGLNSIDGMVERIKKAIEKLREIGNQDISINVTVTGSVIDTVSGSINVAADNIDAAFKRIKLNYDKTVNVSIETGAVSNTVVAVINAQARRIKEAVANIPSTITKTVKVSIGTSSNYQNGLPMPGHIMHTGGLIGKKPIYRSSGGMVMMKPKGKDIIPAMLAKGEYVMRKRAVDALGAPFMQKLNHLDIKGALNSLSAKAGRSALPTGRTVINNKTINHTNKPNITINNPTGNGGVGLVQASRWAHSF